ncbi:MAG: type I secretion system permease/ATPase [Hyphomicrobiaceae bacterium]
MTSISDHFGRHSSNPVAGALARCRSGLLSVGFFSCLMNLLLLTGPFFMLQIYDRVLTSRSVSTLLGLALIASVLYLFYGAFDWIRSRLLARVSKAFDQQVSEESFRQSTRIAAAGSTPAQDLRQVQQFIAGPSLGTLFDVPWFPVYLAVVFLLHPLLGVLALTGAVLLVVIAIINQWVALSLNARSAQHAAQEDKLLLAARRQVEPLQAMGMIANAHRLWDDARNARLEAQTRGADRQGFFASSSKTLRLVLQSAILGFGAYLVIGNELSAGALIAASIIFARALAPLDQTIAQWRSISASCDAYRRLKMSLADVPPVEEGMRLSLPHKSFAVSELSVAVPDRSVVLMDNASFSLKAGDALGIIGPSGGGKTSLLKGLLGLWPANDGDVRFDGATLDQWSAARRGQIIGYLPQDIELFPGTIAQNIARFDSNTSSKSVLDAAALARVHDLIVTKPDGFDTLVGPGGLALSGGERQRIALARAVYQRPFLVVLDEPNSNMDGVGEAALSATIKQLRAQGSIVIVVTHRSNVLSEVNKLMQIQDGRQVQFGDKQDVLRMLREQHQKAVADKGGLRVVEPAE